LIKAGELCAIVLPGEIVRIAPEHLDTFLAARVSPFMTTWRK
jgi:hypothetical protein